MAVLARTAAVVTLSAGGLFAAALPAAADGTPTVDGCPTSYTLLSVSDLALLGYHDPQMVDDPANGGNNDGSVCGKPVNETAAANLCGGPCPVPILYNFVDDSRTPAFKS